MLVFVASYECVHLIWAAMITIQALLKTRPLLQSALTITNKIAYNQSLGYSKGPDNLTYWDAASNITKTTIELQRQIERKQFNFSPCKKVVRRIKYKTREIYISNWTDKIVEKWLSDTLNIKLKRWLSPNAYAYRINSLGLDKCQRKVAAAISGNQYIIRRDISNYFYSIDHTLLLNKLTQIIDENDYLYNLLKQRMVYDYIIDNKRCTATVGIPFGSSISCLFANVYLTELDNKLSALPISYFRYADDFLIICDTKGDADHAATVFDEELQLLKLKQKESHKVDVQLIGNKAVHFLGLDFNSNNTSLSIEKERKIINIFRRNLQYRKRDIDTAASLSSKIAIAVDAVNEMLLQRIRSVSIIDYYLKHINDEQQLKRMDMKITELVISIVLGKPFRRRDFAKIPYYTLRRANLPSLLHRHRLIHHGHLQVNFMSLRNELRILRGVRAVESRYNRYNQVALCRKLRKSSR